ncbi:MAG: putative peptidoglycan glycosyltransferase FtsW [Candidatus Gastranaerophilales bacterium]|nr:putative peptidoglycan glycosyltransferase FtsW [Candidatus Gastranaerophilales bacterium]
MFSKSMSYQRYNRNYNNNMPPSGSSVIISPPDMTILIVTAFLVVIGIMAIFSAGAPKSIMMGENPASFAFKQMGGLVISTVGLLYFAKFDYKKLSKWAVPFAWFVIAMLALVDFTPLGVTVNGAKRWIMFGPIQFQPSEFAKPAVILLLANAFHRDANIFDETKIMRYFVPIIIMVLLVFKQPNLSMVMLLGSVSVITYLNAGGSMKMFFSVVGTGILSMFFLIKPYQLSRIKIWFNPEIDPYGAGYNIIQSLLAFAAGGLWGVGFGNSKQKLAWLPEGHTDFIFAVIGEEFGFLGCLLIIGLFLTLLQRGLTVASRCSNMFGKLLASGITFSIVLQAFINMGVSSSFIPATGVPLPFISYGVSSLVVSMCMIGVLLNISKKRIRRISTSATNPIR